MEKKSPIEEAQCYVDNAKQTLIDNGEYDSDLKRYGDRKYVKSAVSIQLGSHRADSWLLTAESQILKLEIIKY